MKKENLFYKEFYGREALFINFLFSVVNALASLPKLLIEVFVRRNMGARYFNLASGLFTALILAVWPFVIEQLVLSGDGRSSGYYGSYGSEHDPFWSTFSSWYAFLAFFVVFVIIRATETWTPMGAFNLDRFSYYTGDLLWIFRTIPFTKRKASVYLVETILEPAFCFIVGFVFWVMYQKIGMVIMVSSIIYSLSNFDAYRRGSNFVYDLNDQRLLNEKLESNFASDDDHVVLDGTRIRLTKPNSQDLRNDISSFIVSSDNDLTMAL